LTILRRFDCILEPSKENVLAKFDTLKGKSENIVSAQLRTITGVPFYNLSKLTFKKLLADLGKTTAEKRFTDRMVFLKELKAVDQRSGVSLSALELKIVLDALGEKDEWIDHSKTRVGYEIPLNRHFYRYEPPRALEEITADIKELESESWPCWRRFPAMRRA